MPFPCQPWLDLLAELEAARSVSALAEGAARGRALCQALLEERGGPHLLGRSLAALSDRVTLRAIELARQHFCLPQAAWCWLAFGSEGREEQTLLTDQDNGLVFAARDSQEAEALQASFLPFAQTVNDTLDACGYQRCKGNVMAGNPECCLSRDEWQERFHGWLRCPDPEALLKSSIYFDLRGVAGDLGLADDLKAFILTQLAQAPAFLHLLTENALTVAPPLGMLGELQGQGGLLDLKKFGTRLFVDGARILALATGVEAVGTVERLGLAGPRAGMGAGEVAAAQEGFLYLQQLRLHLQQQRLGSGEAADNRVRLDQLSELEQGILKLVFRQARILQHKIGHNYGLSH